MIKFTTQEVAEMETLTLTKRIAREYRTKGALTTKQLAGLLNISEKTIFKMAKAGRIPSFRVGTCVRFDGKLVIDWLREQRR